MSSISTIGNATLIAYDEAVPILSTDPWFGDEDHAYFGSWTLSHEIPTKYKKDILDSKYIWFSHGHPDHLNPLSIKRLEGKNLLLPDHIGSRIYRDLTKKKKYSIDILPDRTWVQLSKKIRVMCITTIMQDGILLLDVAGRLFINLNDAGTKGATKFIQQEARSFQNVYLLSLSGYGDADMINCYDKDGVFIIPPAKNNTRVGEQLSISAKSVNANHVIPFSSHHQYQRTDSIWAQEYVTPIHAYDVGMHKDINFIPPFVDLDCNSGSYNEIKPLALSPKIMHPEDFDDNWTDELIKEDRLAIKKYFSEKEVIHKRFGFIDFLVGGKNYTVNLNKRLPNRGIRFELPRSSLMKAINFEIFDDLLIGNFMRTTFFGINSLYDHDFNPLLTKYADNGGAKTEQEVHAYISEYKKRVGRRFIFETFLDKSANILNRFLTNRNSRSRRLLKSLYYKIK
tara:strand:- start:5283 stop:6644 length:1362 start_codon:yes stop_codon:yes gene_type:complete